MYVGKGLRIWKSLPCWLLHHVRVDPMCTCVVEYDSVPGRPWRHGSNIGSSMTARYLAYIAIELYLLRLRGSAYGCISHDQLILKFTGFSLRAIMATSSSTTGSDETHQNPLCLTLVSKMCHPVGKDLTAVFRADVALLADV